MVGGPMPVTKQHPQIQFQPESHYLYYTSLKTQLPPQAYLRVKDTFLTINKLYVKHHKKKEE